MLCKRGLGCALLAVALAGFFSDQSRGAPQGETVDGWAVHGYADGVVIGYEWYPTRGEAETAKAKMESYRTLVGKYYDQVVVVRERRSVSKGSDGPARQQPRTAIEEIQESVEQANRAKELLDRVKEAKEAVDHAKKISNGEESFWKADERKLFDTVKEYKDMLEKSLKQATEAQKTLTSGVGGLTDDQFKKVNQLVDRYNSDLTKLQNGLGKTMNLGLTPQPRIRMEDVQEAGRRRAAQEAEKRAQEAAQRKAQQAAEQRRAEEAARERIAAEKLAREAARRAQEAEQRVRENMQRRQAAFQRGSQVRVEWQGEWWDATVLEVRGGYYYITYDGYESNWDEWVGPSRISRRR